MRVGVCVFREVWGLESSTCSLAPPHERFYISNTAWQSPLVVLEIRYTRNDDVDSVTRWL